MTTNTQPFKKGQTVTFKGYEALGEDQDELLVKDERLKIEAINDDGSLVVYSERKDEDGNLIGDQVFPEEIEAIAEEEAATEAEPVAEAKPKRARKAAAEKPAAETAAKGKNATKVKAEKPAKAKKEVAKVEADPDLIVITDSDAVTSILDESEDAVAAAKALIDQGERTDFTLGGVLHHILSEGIHKTVIDPKTNKAYEGKSGFANFVEAELGLLYRKSAYLISIYTTFRQLDIDEAKLQEMGWSKAKELVRIAKLKDAEGNNIGLKMLQDNFDDLAEFAKTHDRDALISKIRTDYLSTSGTTTGNSENRIQRTTLKFALVGEQATVVTDALNEAKTRVEGDNDAAKMNAALELICGEWAMLNADMDQDQVIAMVQNKFGITLAVVDPDQTVESVTEDAPDAEPVDEVA